MRSSPARVKLKQHPGSIRVNFDETTLDDIGGATAPSTGPGIQLATVQRSSKNLSMMSSWRFAAGAVVAKSILFGP